MKRTLRTLLWALPSLALADPSGAVTNTDVRSMMDVLDVTAPTRHNYFALTGTVHKPLQSHLGIKVWRERHHLVPVAGSTPVVLDEIRPRLVGLGLHLDGVHVCPFHIGAEVAHGTQRKVDIRT